MHTQTRPIPAARVSVRRTEWERRFNRAGLTTHTARGAALGVSHTTALRVASGAVPPSAAIIGAALDRLGCRFEELFEIETATTSAA